MKNMFVFDYDGTYHRNKVELKENIQLMNDVRKDGHLLVIATGRSYESFIKEIEKYQIEYDYLILSSGALVISKNKDVIKSYPMDLGLVKEVDSILSPYKEKLYNYMFIDEFKNSIHIDQLKKVIKITYTFDKNDMSYEVRDLIDSYSKETFKTYVIAGTNYDYVESISSLTNKANAISDLLTYIKEDYRVITVGDSENDIEMIEAFDGYLMSNHDPKLDNKTYRIIDSIKSLVKIEITE